MGDDTGEEGKRKTIEVDPGFRVDNSFFPALFSFSPLPPHGLLYRVGIS